jgi:chromosomal replication initiation ATPase DnaA
MRAVGGFKARGVARSTAQSETAASEASTWARARARAAQALLAAGAAAYATGARIEDIMSVARGANAASAARQLAMYLMHTGFGASLAVTAEAFGRDRSTVAHAVRVIEERRDDGRFDALVDALAAMLDAAPTPLAHAKRAA